MKLIPLTQGKFAQVDDEDYDYLMQFRWYVNNQKGFWYVLKSFNGGSISMHRFIMNPPKDMVVDHIDHNTLNNQRSNLRICTRAQNNMNSNAQKGKKTSKYKGVCLRTLRSKRKYGYWEKQYWMAYISINNKIKTIGLYPTEKDAALAYNEAAKKHQGEFA